MLTDAFDPGDAGELAGFAPARRALTLDEMQLLVDRALVLLRDFYVHLPMKRVVHAADPERRLRVLGDRLLDMRDGDVPPVSEAEFHRLLGAVFTDLRDRHTTYILPQPYRSAITYLPFMVESVDDGHGPRFIVSRVFGEPEKREEFDKSTVTHWNGMPIERAVELNADRNAGANPSARLARGLDRLTFRWMGLGGLPDEDWVVVTYLAGGKPQELRFPWRIVQRPAWEPASGSAAAVDREGEWIRRVKTHLFFPQPPDRALLKYTSPSPERDWGHLRIFSFDVDDGGVAQFVAGVAERLAGDRPAKLIIDVRGNPGGHLVAAERLIQLFSPVPVEPEGLEFINTPAGLDLASRYFAGQDDFEELRREARATATPYVKSLPLAGGEDYNDIGRLVDGRVAVIVDALTYSAAEVFAAGMQDHGAADIYGTSRQSGGGGGNVWTYDDVRATLPRGLPVGTLPWESSFDVAIRRLTRVGPRAGVSLEDLGVVVPPGNIHAPTTADVLGGNRRLLAFVADRLENG